MLDMRFNLYLTPGYRVTNSEFGVVPKLARVSVKVAVSILSSIEFRIIQQISTAPAKYSQSSLVVAR
jgi:hypothetical protein